MPTPSLPSPTAPIASVTSTTHKVEIPEFLKKTYILFYRHGMNANLTKGFYFDGTFVDAQKRARLHCDIMGYKFIFLRPMICDIDAEERQQRQMPEGSIAP